MEAAASPQIVAHGTRFVPGPSALSLRFRWLSPLVVSLIICSFATAGFAFTLRRNDTDGTLTPGYLAALVVLAVSLVGAIACLWTTYCSDPGYLLPQVEPDAAVMAVLQGSRTGEEAGLKFDPSSQRWLDVAGRKYCEVCNVWRPPRAAHCYECGFCVERHDHHCGVVGNCIARRNHATFAGMLVCSSSGLVVLICCAAAQVHERVQRNSSADVGLTWLHILLLALYGIMTYAVVPFAATHAALVLSNGVTRNLLRSHGTASNMRCFSGLTEVCCVPCQLRDGVLHAWRKSQATASIADASQSVASSPPPL